MEYLIYSDESNHDRSITKKNEETFSVLNIDKKNQSREYVRSYCVISSGINQNLKKDLLKVRTHYEIHWLQINRMK